MFSCMLIIYINLIIQDILGGTSIALSFCPEKRCKFYVTFMDASGWSACIFLEDNSRVLIKMVSIVYNLDKVTHILR